ncbi:hypothetical protein SLS56_011274 [Neofusicoccum ribis]|uniref:Azaphilone pigments biosynthesis cluster protein L N-terminal domain-containing protein n=1 Tax=Neofusicoccum ribis TaxID=45134 RepID=A0ABR3SC25_9PEZI
MDVVSAGSSVLAFVGIALKSTEAIYKVISGIRDGPDKVERLKSAVKALRAVLNQLSDLPLHKQLASAQLTAELEDAIRRCEDDIRSFSKKLSSLQNSDSDKKWTTAWQRVKTVLKSEDLSEMLAAVTNHVTTLSAFLGVRQSIVALEQTHNISALQQTTQSQFDLVASSAQLLQPNAATLTSFTGQLNSFKDHSNMAQRSTEQALDRLGQRIDAMPSFSQTQFDVIKNMLETLSIQQGHRTQPDSSGTSHQSFTEDSDSDSDPSIISLPRPRRSARPPSLLPSIRKLESLVDSKEKTIGSSEANDIIKELQKLLGAVCKGPLARVAEKRKHDDEDPVMKLDVKRIRGFLDTTYKVKVNDEKPNLRVRDPAQSIDKRRSSTVLINEGSIFLRTRTRWSRGTDSRQTPEDNEKMDENILEFAANLTFTPSLPELRMKLSMSFYQRMTSDGLQYDGKNRILEPRLWHEVLETHGYDPEDFGVFVVANPHTVCRSENAIYIGNKQTDRSSYNGNETSEAGNLDLSDYLEGYGRDNSEEAHMYSEEDYGASESEKTDSDSESSEPASDLDTELTHEAWTSTRPITKPAPPPGTFWAVIDHAVEQEGNPWE